MNREYYNNLSEAYQQVNEGEFQKGYESTGDSTKGIGSAARETEETFKDYAQGLFKGKKISSSAPTHARAANAVGRVGNKLGGGAFNRLADMAVKGGKAALKTGEAIGKAGAPAVKGAVKGFGANVMRAAGSAKKHAENIRKGYKQEEIEALLNSPHLTEEEKEAFIAMIDEERKDEAGMSPDEKSIGRSIKAGMNPATDHMAAATRQRLHLSQRGKKKPTAHSKETRLPAQQLKARKANDGVKEMGEEYVSESEAFKKGYDSTDGKTGYVAGKRLRKVSDAVTAGAPTAMQKAYKTGQSAGKALGKKLGLGEEDILSTMMDDLLGENRLTPAALEAAAAANQKRDKARGMKIHSTQGVKDLFSIKPGKV